MSHLLTWLLLLSFFTSNAQESSLTFEETLAYINKVIKENKWSLSKEVTESIGFECDNHWTVSDDGLLKITRTCTNDVGVTSITSIYLKRIKVTGLKTGKSFHSIILTCYLNPLDPCIRYDDKTEGESINWNDTRVDVNNIIVAERLKKAIEHLLYLADKNDNFKTKDPFDD